MGLLAALKLKLPPPGAAKRPAGPAAKKTPAKAGSRLGRVGQAVMSATLEARVKAADAQMNAALTAANQVGNPLEHRTRAAPGSKARTDELAAKWSELH